MRVLSPWKTLCLAAIASFCLILSGCSDDSPSDSNGGGWTIGDDTGSGSDSDTGTCTPGETGMDDCNYCECDDQGRWMCTAMGCIEDVYEDDTDSPDAGTCTPGETKEVDCNSCHCTEDGEWGCTTAACLPDDPCENKACGDACSTCDPDADGNCPPVMEYCNAEGECEMGADPVCPGDSVCTPGDEQRLDCNACVCNEMGTWDCTEQDCDGLEAPCEGLSCGEACTVCPEDDPDCVESDQPKFCTAEGRCVFTDAAPECLNSCREGETRQDDCNTCVCDADGNWSCTEMACSGYQPCEGLTCGDECTICPPHDPTCSETGVLKFCNKSGVCAPTTPTCDDAPSPCEGKVCGEACSTCDPTSGSCPTVMEYCDEDGHCGMAQPACTDVGL